MPRPRSLLPLALLLALAAPALAHDWNGIAADAAGRMYVVDAEDGQVWRVDAEGRVTVYVEGAADDAPCRHPHHVALDGDGVLWLPSG